MTFSVGQRVIFVFGYCMGIPNYDEGVITKIDGEWVTIHCDNTGGQKRIPLKGRGTGKYDLTLHVSRLLKGDDESRVIDAWHTQFHGGDGSKKESSGLLITLAQKYFIVGSGTAKDFRVTV